MSAPAAGVRDARADGASWWVRSIVGWHVAAAVMLGIAVVVLVVVPGERRALAAAAVAAVALAYVLRGARSATERGTGRPYLVVLVLGLGAAFAGQPELSFLLFLGFPQVWLLSETTREGVAWTLALAVSASAGLVAGYGSLARAPGVATSLGVSVLFSCALGVWISKIIDQSQERAELIAQLEAARAQLAEAHHAAGVAEERARLARDIHDTLAQGFTSVLLLARSAGAVADDPAAVRERLGQVEDAAREGLAEARTLVAAMTPVALSDGGLEQALRRLAERVSRESGVAVDVQVEVDARDGGAQGGLGGLGGLGRPGEVVLLRAAQEALGNVRRHARATRARVRLCAGADGVVLEVVDDGVGLPPGAEEGGRGYGLAGTRRRVEEAGGRFDVGGAPGGGTVLRVRVPAGAAAAAVAPGAPGAPAAPAGSAGGGA
ncbi:sensor histidine kinase [Kineococcus terrestris]|uniref:sensor histidine kinase n=1 Tax=Kineococcus terrestris TaxID=2044856 RepID=UPI0034DB0716